MSWRNTKHGYGGLTKFLHWAIVVLFAWQYLAGVIMTRMTPQGVVLGLSQDIYFNWHKSIGLVALAVAIARLINRRRGRLPDWAPTLSDAEKKFIPRAEQILYAAMLVMPISGFVYVMAGGYGVRLFGLVDLANPIGRAPLLASAAQWTHFLAGIALALTLAGHIGLVLRHQLILKDGLLRRMLPRR
jgi:cytochrome b561